MTLTVLNQSITMFLLIIVGVICAKINMLSEKTCKQLSKLLLQIVNPAMIFIAYNKKFETALLENLLFTLLFSALAMIAAVVTAYIFIRKKDGRETEIERFSVIYSNCGFMGIPLINAMYGYDGVFYLTAYLTAFNLCVWSHGVIMMSGKRDLKSVLKVFYSTTMIAIFLGLIRFVTQIELPEVVTSAITHIANMNTPLAMIVSGGTIARSGFFKGLKKWRIYYCSAVKLIIIPLIVSLIVMFVPIDPVVKAVVIMASAAPSASMGTLFALQYDKNADYASEIFAVATILSIATLPLMTKIMTAVL
ncbi:MAG: AEC family transporter [Oscillospiraceae bacterium]|nr:AEC family transporter [Oscillospiraceae bacterium]MDD6086324.1 AEC family transporter [Oscillospiraceae bacterium]MDY3257281.1 AEC family transporter [Ruminococcus callidus]